MSFSGMKNLIIGLFFGIALPTFGQQNISLSIASPPPILSMFGEHVVSTSINERDFALSPDGKELFYTISTPKSTFQTIVYCRMIKEGEWTAPEVAAFAGEFSDLEPSFSADGQTLFFSSNRPINGNTPKDFDIWKVTRNGKGWGRPENLGAIINTDSDEFYPSIAKSGNLYFTAAYVSGIGKEDIYMSTFSNNKYQKPMALDTAVNSKLYEFNAFVSPDEQYILFTSYGRKDDAGGGDLYISLKDKNGKWNSARNLKELNSKQLDYCPFISSDGKSLFFTSERHLLPVSFASTKATFSKIIDTSTQVLNGTGNIYWIDFSKVLTTTHR